MPDGPGFDAAALPGGPPYLLEVIVALERHDFRPRPQIDGRVVFNAAYEIPRHGVGQSVPAHEHVNASAFVRQVHRCLTGGVATADDGDLLPRAHLTLHLGGGVVDSRTFEPREVLDRGPAILRAGCYDHTPRRHLRTVIHRDGVRMAAAGDARRTFCHRHL